MNTQTNIAWYYVGVGVLMLFGQNYLLSTAHKEQVAKLNAKLAAAGVVAAPVAVAPATGAAAALNSALANSTQGEHAVQTGAASPTPPPASTLNQPAPAAQASAPATQTAAKADTPKEAAKVPATETKTAPATFAAAETKPAAKPILASPAPSSGGKTLPIVLSYRSEPFEKSKIVTLTNSSKEPQALNVKVRRPKTGESHSFKVTIAAAGEARLVGNDNSWIFTTGDRIEVAQAGYKSKTSSVP